MKQVFKNNNVQTQFEKWMSVTAEPSFNQPDMERLFDLAISIVKANESLDEKSFVKAIKKHYCISATHCRGQAQLIYRILANCIEFYKYLKKK
ncbi:MAG: hypothetical protein KBS55_00385 [Bacteroidales bacterium]|nr:hypothetical protein [Candidatus Cryptobacteroides aphodequi]